MAADALVAQERLTHREFSSATARRTVGRERCDRGEAVPRVAWLADWAVISAGRHLRHPDWGAPRHRKQEVRGMFPPVDGP